MLIRSEQILAFERIDPPAFERDMLHHIRRHFPKHYALLQPEEMLRVIRLGRERAAQYGMTTRHQVCLFVDLRIMLGSGFDTDPQLPWVAPLLQESTSADERIDQLYASAMQYLDRVVGEDEVFPVEELRSIIGYPLEPLEQTLAQNFASGMLNEFQRIWPRKYSETGADNLNVVVSKGLSMAAAYGLNTRSGVGFYLLHMFLVGHQFDTDPLYPALAAALADPNGAERLDRFYQTGQQMLAKALGPIQ